MRVHLVIAHPEKRSFNYALHESAKALLNDARLELTETDLYSMSFNPIAGPDDIEEHPQNKFFDLIKEQRLALENDGFEATIRDEQTKLFGCDLLILQFPLWWCAFPAILKGWVDRVFSSGFAYGKGAILTPKKVMYSITTGGASSPEEEVFYQQKIDGLYQDIFGFMGWQALPPFIAHGVQQMSQAERAAIIENYRMHINQHILNPIQ